MKNRLLINIIFLVIVSFSCNPQPKEADSESADKKPNVLFIAIDDLRPELGCYGAPAITPNIDKLASEGVLFNHHYVQFAVCIPSRVALLTGMRSERTKQRYGPPVWQEIEGAQSWGNTFKQAGYQTASIGKIWHIEGGTNIDKFDVEWKPHFKHDYAFPENQEKWLNFRKLRKQKVAIEDIPEYAPIAEAADVHDSTYVDGKSAIKAIEVLKEFAKNDEPFMMALGFVKPHLPLNAPKKYWDLYDSNAIELAPNPDFPQNMPDLAFSNHPNFYNYDYGDYPPLERGKAMPNSSARHLRHAYRAATSYSDAQVGLVLRELDKLGLSENTIVVLWGDHGWHLGDAGHWGKQTNFEYATRSPLIIKAPGVSKSNVKTNSLVETVDIFPTLLELCGIAPAKISDGNSLIPLLQQPNIGGKEAVFHVFNRGKEINGKRELVIGHAVRTKDYRFISWRVGWGLNGQELATELYDYKNDPLETKNVVDDPAYSEVKQTLQNLLAKGPAGEI